MHRCNEQVGDGICGAEPLPGDVLCGAHRSAHTALEVQQAEEAAQALREAAERVLEFLNVRLASHPGLHPEEIAGLGTMDGTLSLNASDLRLLVESAFRATEVD